MNTQSIIREIAATEARLKEAQEVIASYTIPDPYCFILPVIGFFTGFQAHSLINTNTALSLLKTQLMLHTLPETRTDTQP